MRRPGLFELTLYALAALGFCGARALRARAAPPFEPGVRAATSLRVVTWNVGGVETTGTAGAARPLSSENLEHVARVLVELDADLIALQELERHAQRRAIEQALGDEWESASPAGDGSRVAWFVRNAEFTRFPIAGAGARGLGIELSPEARAPGAIAVTVHANAFASDERNALLGAACDELLERARKLAPERGPGRAQRPLLLLVGDFNLDLDLDKRGDLFSDDQYRDVETYNYVANVLADAARGNGSTAEPDRRLDYVFVEDSAWSVRAAGPWKGRRGRGMDHDPVVADLQPR